MLKKLDTVVVVNSPVNYPQLWNKFGTVVHCWNEDYFEVEFSDDNNQSTEQLSLYKGYLREVVDWILSSPNLEYLRNDMNRKY